MCDDRWWTDTVHNTVNSEISVETNSTFYSGLSLHARNVNDMIDLTTRVKVRWDKLLKVRCDVMLVAAWLLLFASTCCWCDGDSLDIIAWSMSIAAGSILDLLLRHDPVNLCHSININTKVPAYSADNLIIGGKIYTHFNIHNLIALLTYKSLLTNPPRDLRIQKPSTDVSTTVPSSLNQSESPESFTSSFLNY